MHASNGLGVECRDDDDNDNDGASTTTLLQEVMEN